MMFEPSLFDLGEDHSLYEKDRTTGMYKPARILITVKANPQPSAKYGDTVCVAGIWLDGDKKKWIRLYPVPFRSLDELNQFKKYELIEVPVLPNGSDFRAESYKPDNGSIKKLGRVEKWKHRHEYLTPFIGKWTMCSILKAQRESKNGAAAYPSLALVKPRKIVDLEVKPFEGWSEKQQQSVDNSYLQVDLFSIDKEPVKLEEPRFKAVFHYFCTDDGCNGHHQSFLDWEVEALSRRLRYLSDEDAIEQVRRKYLDVICPPSANPYFFVGNIKASPKAFNVLGVYRGNGD